MPLQASIVHYSKNVIKIAQTKDLVEVLFDDGTTATGNSILSCTILLAVLLSSFPNPLSNVESVSDICLSIAAIGLTNGDWVTYWWERMDLSPRYEMKSLDIF